MAAWASDWTWGSLSGSREEWTLVLSSLSPSYTIHSSCLHIPNWSKCTFQLLLFYPRFNNGNSPWKFSLHSSLTQGNIFLTRCYTLYIIYDTILNRAVQYNLSLLIWITLKTYYFTWSLGKSGAEAEISRQEDDWDMFFEITQR